MNIVWRNGRRNKFKIYRNKHMGSSPITRILRMTEWLIVLVLKIKVLLTEGSNPSPPGPGGLGQ
jgi:hypothetical protein